MVAERRIRVQGEFVPIWSTLLSYPTDWEPPEDDDDLELPIHEWSVEGRAGTGKTFFEGLLVKYMHMRYPRLRSLVVRKTRVSLSDSWMQVFEDDVLGPNHPMVRGVSRDHRRKYVWPNGSETRLAGMDEPTRLFSTQYDLVIVVEGIEFTLDEYQSIYRATRGARVPFKAIIVDTNPGAETHFLNRVPDKPDSSMERIRTSVKDNPLYWNAEKGKLTASGRQYERTLDKLTGTLRKRLRDGLWCAAEGAIYENWDPKIHIVKRGEITKDKPDGENLPDFDYFIGGIDWGWNDAKVLQVWGVTKDRRMYRVFERYGTHVTMERFVGWLEEAWAEYGDRRLVRIVADHDPEKISYCNEKMGWRGGRKRGNMVFSARKGAKSIEAGIELVRDLLGDPEHEVEPRLFLVEGALREADAELDAENLPTCTEQEIPAYIHKPKKDGGPEVNVPDPGCIDHGCDVMRYVATEVWKTDFRSPKQKRRYEPGTYGYELGHRGEVA